MATYHIEARTWHGDPIGEITSEPGEAWQQALTRLYKRVHKTRKPYHVATANHFQGGSTWHVQMGYRVGRAGDDATTLDETIIVRVEQVEEAQA